MNILGRADRLTNWLMVFSFLNDEWSHLKLIRNCMSSAVKIGLHTTPYWYVYWGLRVKREAKTSWTERWRPYKKPIQPKDFVGKISWPENIFPGMKIKKNPISWTAGDTMRFTLEKQSMTECASFRQKIPNWYRHELVWDHCAYTNSPFPSLSVVDAHLMRSNEFHQNSAISYVFLRD